MMVQLFGGNHLSTTVLKSVLKILKNIQISGKLGENIKYFNSCFTIFYTDKYQISFAKKWLGIYTRSYFKNEND